MTVRKSLILYSPIMFYLYRYSLDPINANTRYTPSMNFDTKFSEVKGIVTLEDEMIPESLYKVLPNGQISGLRLGQLTADYTALAQFGFTEQSVIDLLNRVGSAYCMELPTNPALASFIRNYTDVPELSENVFELRPAYHDALTDKDIPAKTINLC